LFSKISGGVVLQCCLREAERKKVNSCPVEDGSHTAHLV